MGELTVVDYIVFSLMLVISSVIGIYHGYKGRKQQQTTASFLMADRSMSKFPIAISLAVSFLSAIAILGIPSEVYTYGFAYVLVGVAFTAVMLISAFLYVPVFYDLEITSTNEYLEMRFTPGIRLCGSILFIITYTLYMSIALYAPALALEAVSGLSMLISIVVNGLVCIFYTTLGGLKAVIWTDVFQGLIISIGIISIFISGTMEVGGLSNVWEISQRMNRTDVFNFDPDPTVRSTFWTLTIGAMFSYLLSWSVSQLSVQRFLATKSLKEAQSALLMNIPVMLFLSVVLSLDGLVIFAVYADCDLVKEGKITRNDQILPYFVVDKLNYMNGLPGLFIASLFSGCLSTVSSGINSLSAIILEDIVKKLAKKDISEAKATFYSKIIGVTYGTIIVCGAIILKYLKVSLLIQLTATLFNLSAGPLLGLFTLGMLTRKANWKGAYIGQATALAFLIWVYTGSLSHPIRGNKAPISVEECTVYNVTRNLNNHTTFTEQTDEPLSKLYGISFWYYGLIGVLITVIVGLLASLLLETSDDRDRAVDEKLLFKIKWPTRLLNKITRKRSDGPVVEKCRQKPEDIAMTSVVNNGFHHN